MNGAGALAMSERDWFRRFLERVLPWFDPVQHERELIATARELELSRQALARTNRQLAEVRRVEHVIRKSRG